MRSKKAKGPVAKPPVEIVTDPISGRSVVVFYNRETGDFYADEPMLQERIVHKDVKGCVKLVQAALERARHFDWKAVIVIEHAGDDRVSTQRYGRGAHYMTRGARLTFSYYRCEIAPKPGSVDARFVQRPHSLDVAGDDEICDGSVEAVHRSWRRQERQTDRDIHDHFAQAADIIPYTPEAWDALARLGEATLNTYAALAQLFQRPAALALAAPAPMLVSTTDPRADEQA